MAYRKPHILEIQVLLSLVLIPLVALQSGRQWAKPIGSADPNMTITRTPTLINTITLSPSTDPTVPITGTNTPTPSPIPTLTPTLTATVSVIPTSSPSPTSPPPPSACPCPVYLPLVFFFIPQTVVEEVEPNNTFAQAQPLSDLPASVNGTHDGETDTGDVYQIELTAGQIVHITLTTVNPIGVQLLAYHGENPNEFVRDFEAPFELTFLAIATGSYFLYVYTPANVNNTGAYTLSVALTEAVP